MIMLPAFRRVSQETGVAPICIVSSDYATIFDGVSYVRPWVMDVHWWRGVGPAREMAQKAGFDPIVVKWWDEPGAKPPISLPSAKLIRLTIHGRPCVIPASEWDSFQASQWRYAGFTMEQMMKWPLVFDRRDADREQQLKLQHFKPRKKNVLINVSRVGSSPFHGAIQASALARMPGVNLIDLAAVRAFRIFDLLGMYDSADGLITSDTATLHLAAGSSVPYIALLNDGGAGSIPRGNCVLSIRYGQFKQRLGEYHEALRAMLEAN